MVYAMKPRPIDQPLRDGETGLYCKRLPLIKRTQRRMFCLSQYLTSQLKRAEQQTLQFLRSLGGLEK